MTTTTTTTAAKTTTRKTIKAPRKKAVTAPPRRIRTGLPAVPMMSFDACKRYFHQEIDKKVVAEIVKVWVKKSYSKENAKAILACPEYHFHMYAPHAAIIHWMNAGMEFTETKQKGYPEVLKKYYDDLIPMGNRILAKTITNEDGTAVSLSDGSSAEPSTVKPSPAQLLMKKIQSTIMVDIDFLEDEWLENKTTKIDLYNKFQQHQLKGVAVQSVRDRLTRWLNEYEDAYLKRCDQAVEGYSYLKRTELKRRIDAIKVMLEDLSKVKAASAATRAPRAPKTRAADKQIVRLQYLKSSEEYKLKSTNPIQIPGSMRLYTFNEKTRTLSEYVCDTTKGFEVKGTSIQNFNADTSRAVRLRKPDQFLAIILTKTFRQIDNEWKKLTTKSTVPTGRINKDTVLLRVMDQ